MIYSRLFHKINMQMLWLSRQEFQRDARSWKWLIIESKKKKKIALSTGGFRGSDLLVNLGGKWKLREESIVKGEKKKNTSVIKLSKKRKGFWRACIALTTTTSRSSIQFNFLGTYHEGIHCFIPSLLTNLLQDAS